MRKKLIVGLLVIAGGVAGLACYGPRGGTKELRLPGTVEIQEVRLASKVGGRVVAVNVREGDVVEAGRVVVAFDDAELTARRDQALARHDAARAALYKAHAGPRPEEIAEAAGAADAARARLAKLKAGSREEEKEQARQNLATAVAEERQAQQDFERIAEGFGRGVIGQGEYQTALALRDRSKARTGAAKATLDMTLTGPRQEEIAEAAAEVARWSARHELLKKGTREEDKALAAADAARAEAELAEAQTMLREAKVVAPERCVVEVLAVRPGDVVQAGQPVARVLRADDLWVKVFIPSTELGKLRLGQKVEVAIDSHPGRRFAGEVVHIAASAEFTPRNVQSPDERKHQVFAVKVRVTDADGIFKSGMAADVFVTLSE
jgi:multidrug resistance efflux pump